MIRILIVDDQNIVRAGIRAILESKPELEIVGTAGDGISAIEQASILKPDIAIVDIEMPNMNGITTTQKICQQFPNLKVLILSSHNSQEYVMRAVQAGAWGYLLKNTLEADLEQTIWSVYRGNSQIQSKQLRESLVKAINKPPTKPPNDLVELNGSIPKVKVSRSNSNLVSSQGQYFRNTERKKISRHQTLPKTKPAAINKIGNYTPQHQSHSQDYCPKSSKTAPLKKSWLVVFGILGLLITGGTIVYSLNLGDRQTTVTAQEETREAVWWAVTALGRIEPEGETIALSPPPNMGGARIGKLMVTEGQQVQKDQLIALLDNHAFKQAALNTVEQELEVARVNLAIVRAGAKTGDIQARKAIAERLEAELAGKVKTQTATVARLKAQLRREKEAQLANLERSQAELNNAKVDFQRYQQLAKDGAIANSELDSRRLTLQTAQQQVREARANYDRTIDTLQEEIKAAQATKEEIQQTIVQQIQEAKANVASITEIRPLDVKKAEAELERAVANRQQAQQDLELTQIKSPIDGQVLRVNAHPGEMVVSEEGVVELGHTEQMVVIAEIYESDISRVDLGQQATIVSEGGAFQDKLQGQVSHIRPEIRQQEVFDTDPAADVDTRIIEVKIALNPDSSKKVARFTNSKVIVTIELDRSK